MDSNKTLVMVIVGLIIAVVAGAGAYFIFFTMPPKTDKPTVVVVDKLPDDIRAHIASKSNLISLASPAPLAEISSPVHISGEARGPWYFEASFPVFLADWDGKIIAQGVATAEGNWMTTEFVPFTATLTYNSADISGQYSNKGTLILKKDNPSGLPEHDDALEVPVVLK